MTFTTPLNVGTDFSGIGAFEQAMKRLKIPHNVIFACDINKYARITYEANHGTPPYFPHDVYEREIPKNPLDIYVSTCPCQAFSMSGKRLGEADDRGILFYNSHEFINVNRPRFFFFENVKGLLSDDGGRTFQRWLDFLGGKTVNGNPVIFPHEKSVPYHIYYKVLNAKEHNVPQNRERVFIVGIRDDQDNNFNWPKPEQLTKRLKDVLETDVDEKYFLSDKMMDYLETRKDNFNNGKINFKDGESVASTLTKSSSSIDLSDNIIKLGNVHPSRNGMNGNVFCANGISPTLSTNKGEGIKIKSATTKGYGVATEGDSINYKNLASNTRRGRVGKEVAQTIEATMHQGVMIGSYRGRNPSNPKSRKKGDYYEQTLEINKENISNTISTVQKDNVVVKTNYIQWDVSGKGHNSQQDRAYFENGVMATIPSSRTENKVNVLLEEKRILRLTPRECARLMDFPDSFVMPCSDSQMYKQFGNSVVVKMFELLLTKLPL